MKNLKVLKNTMHINDKQTNRVYSWKNDQNPSFGCPLCDEAGTKNSESPWRNRCSSVGY